VRLVAGRTAKNGQCAVRRPRHDKRTILAALLGQFVLRLPHGARQIDLFFYFFLFFTSKNSQKPYT
jgi:predicted LPLAT superfamily acyltransferase